jgi:hypothetical protein
VARNELKKLDESKEQMPVYLLLLPESSNRALIGVFISARTKAWLEMIKGMTLVTLSTAIPFRRIN